MARYIVAEVQCTYDKWVNIQAKETYKGEATRKRCWNCGVVIEFRSYSGYVADKKCTTRIISDEVKKD